MPPRNHKKWLETPNIEYISSECYNNKKIHDQEMEHIFSKVLGVNPMKPLAA